jgi:cell division protein FtsQ
MRQLSFNDRLAPKRAAAGRPAGRRSRTRTAWFRGVRRRARLLGLSGTAVLLVAAAGWWLLQAGNAQRLGAGAEDVFLDATSGLGLTVQNVYSTGHRESEPAEILAALDINRGDPIFAFSPEQARARVAALDWVESATIERRLPDTIRVHIVERRPFALWQHNQQIKIIDRSGTVINARDVPRYGHLPLIVGADAPHHAPALFDTLRSERAAAARVVSAVRVGARRWDLHFDNGLTVALPEEDTAEAWRRLVHLLAVYDLRQERITAIDLRLPGRAVFRRAPEPAQNGSAT